jgi:hypothetical protein
MAMRQWKLRVPIVCQRVSRQDLLEIELRLDLRTGTRGWKRASFLFDSGSQFTTISTALAERLSIPFSTSHPVEIRGASGPARGYLSPLWFSFADLEDLQFESSCCFAETPLQRPLLSLTDLVRNCTLRTLLPSRLHPLGSLLLRLRQDHRGQRRG